MKRTEKRQRIGMNWKRAAAIMATALLLCTLMPETFANAAQEEGYDFCISTADELRMFSAWVNGTYETRDGTAPEAHPDAGAILMTDIDLSPLCGAGIGDWEPIGAAAPFSGVFNGNHHSITGLFIGKYQSSVPKGSGKNAPQGLFGTIAGAEIRDLSVSGTVLGGQGVGVLSGAAVGNLRLSSCKATGTAKGAESVGLLIGTVSGAAEVFITDPEVSGNVEAGRFSALLCGFMESNYASITNARAEGTVTVSREYAGLLTGLARVNAFLIQHAAANGSVAAGNGNAGLLAGSVIGSGEFMMEACTVSGNVTGAENCGLLFGSADVKNVTVTDTESENMPTVTGNAGTGLLGGSVSCDTAFIAGCAVKGNVLSTDPQELKSAAGVKETPWFGSESVRNLSESGNEIGERAQMTTPLLMAGALRKAEIPAEIEEEAEAEDAAENPKQEASEELENQEILEELIKQEAPEIPEEALLEKPQTAPLAKPLSALHEVAEEKLPDEEEQVAQKAVDSPLMKGMNPASKPADNRGMVYLIIFIVTLGAGGVIAGIALHGKEKEENR